MKGSDTIKVLVFSVSIGDGHDSVAKSLSECLLEIAPDSEIRVVDTFQYINSVLHKVVVGSYMETLRFTPRVWGYLYDQAEEGLGLVDLGQILSKVLSPRLEQLLKEFQPDLIITTHAFPTGMLSVLKKKRNIATPHVAVVTDFHVHPFWINPGVDHYFIPAEDLAYPLVQAGVESSKISAVGIPIRSQFCQQLDQQEAKAELGLGPLPTILVMGGGLGMGRLELISQAIVQAQEFQVIVITGKNKRLYSALNNLNNPFLKVLGYVDNMAKVMTAADIIISKPGGVTTAEVLAMKKPLVIYSSLPGQEDRNTCYLLNKGAAIKVRKLEQLIPEIRNLWQNKLRLKQMREMAELLGSPASSSLVWKKIWPLIKAGPFNGKLGGENFG